MRRCASGWSAIRRGRRRSRTPRARMRPDAGAPWVHGIADRADELALRGFRSPRLRVEEKPDRSPVSDVDKAIEEMARALARERHPGLGVFGEEQGDDPGTAGTRLIVDPIDGTVSFVRGIPVFGTLLAIEAEGEVVASVASAPALGARWHAARGSGAFSGTRRLPVSVGGDLHQAMPFHCDLGSGGERAPPGILRLIWHTNPARGDGDFFQP